MASTASLAIPGIWGAPGSVAVKTPSPPSVRATKAGPRARLASAWRRAPPAASDMPAAADPQRGRAPEPTRPARARGSRAERNVTPPRGPATLARGGSAARNGASVSRRYRVGSKHRRRAPGRRQGLARGGRTTALGRPGPSVEIFLHRRTLTAFPGHRLADRNGKSAEERSNSARKRGPGRLQRKHLDIPVRPDEQCRYVMYTFKWRAGRNRPSRPTSFTILPPLGDSGGGACVCGDAE